MLPGLPTTAGFSAGQGGSFQNGCGPKSNLKKNKKQKDLQGIVISIKTQVEPQGPSRPQPLGAGALAGSCASYRMNLGPEEAPPSTQQRSSVQQDDPTMAVTLQFAT